MKLPDKYPLRNVVEDWEEGIWKELYGDEKSLDGKLVIISERLRLDSMPLLRNNAEKAGYLAYLEDLYYDKVYRGAHEMGEEYIDWSQFDL